MGSGSRRRPGRGDHARRAREVGLAYRQEYYAGEAEDAGEVLSLDERAEVPYGSFDALLMTRDFTLLDPSADEHKYYARGIGPVLTVASRGLGPGGASELRVRLVGQMIRSTLSAASRSPAPRATRRARSSALDSVLELREIPCSTRNHVDDEPARLGVKLGTAGRETDRGSSCVEADLELGLQALSQPA